MTTDKPGSIATFTKEWRLWRALVQHFLNTAGQTKTLLAVTPGAGSVTYTFAYPDAGTDYGVVATPNWGTTTYISARTRTSLTVSFGTVAPANATVDIITFRS